MLSNLKTLLISFQNNTDTIGLKYLHAYSVQNEVDSHMLFIPKYEKNDFGAIERFLKYFKPSIIGISLMSQEFNSAKLFSEQVKSVFPEIKIVWGGIHPSINPKQCLEYADYVFIGESEEAYVEFLNAISKNESINNILNLAYKSDGKVLINNPRPLNKDLDALPYPEHMPKKGFIFHDGQVVPLNKEVFKKYARYSGRLYSLTSTRGCSFSCAYCCNSFFANLYGGLYEPVKVRGRSVENIIAELRHALSINPELFQINITDDNFLSYDEEWVKEFTAAYKKEIGKDFGCRSTPAHLTEDKAKALKEGGLYLLVMGLQSGSPRVNKEIYKRYVPNERFIHSTEIIDKYNLVGKYDVILDNPYETDEDTLQTIDILTKIKKPFIVQPFSLCFYEGTELRARAMEDKLEFESPLKKNFFRFNPTFLNKTVKIAPSFPKSFVDFLIKNRDAGWAHSLLSVCYFVSLGVIEPVVWLWLLSRSFNYNLFKTFNMITVFFKTGYDQMFLRK